MAHHDQETRLEREGIVFVNGRVDLEIYRWEAD